MKDLNPEFIATVGKLVTQHGIPAAINIMQAWNVKNPTPEDIRRLGEMEPAESYFEKE